MALTCFRAVDDILGNDRKQAFTIFNQYGVTALVSLLEALVLNSIPQPFVCQIRLVHHEARVFADPYELDSVHRFACFLRGLSVHRLSDLG